MTTCRILAVALLILGAACGAQEDARPDWEGAIADSRADRAGDAVSAFENSAKLDADPSLEALAEWAISLAAIGREQDADRLVGEARERAGTESAANRKLGTWLARSPSLRADGIAMLEALLKRSPDNRATLRALGRAYRANGQLDRAEDLLRRALAAAPVDGTHHQSIADERSLLPERARPTAPASAPNILLVMVDTLRADHLGSYGYGRPTSPRIDALAAEGVVFEQAMSQAPWTAASAASLLTGLYPSSHGLEHGGRFKPSMTGLPFTLQSALGTEFTTLAELLRDTGDRTGGFVANAYMSALFGLAQGFEVYDDSHEDYSGDLERLKRRADVTNQRATAWVEQTSEPFFLFVHYMEPHWPYDPPPGFGEEFVEGYTGSLTPIDTGAVVEVRIGETRIITRADLDYIVGLYDGEIQAVDHALASLIEHVRRQANERDLLIVFTADHGEEFLEHGGASHGYTLYQEQLHVPLIFHWPGVLKPTRTATPVALVDVMPTLAALAAPQITSLQFDGQDLGPLLRGEQKDRPGSIHSEATYLGDWHALRSGNFKLVERPDERQLFDLEKDPGEQLNLAANHETHTAELAAESERFRNRSVTAGETRVRLDDEVVRQLEALGYGGAETAPPADP
jgi:arylsulfatase A-like enzyme